MKASIRLGKIAGIEVGVHYSWFVILALITWSLAAGFLPDRYEGWSQVAYWGTAIVAALLLFGSVLVHELAHSLVARARGFPVEGITLFILGGVSNLKAEARGPKDEFVISVAGPLTSLVLAAIFWLVLVPVGDRDSPLAAVLTYLALVNVLLALFNLLPAFPLDGGRVLRSIIWGATHSLSRATSVAARVGQVAGYLLIAAGVFEVLQGNFLGGLWIAFVGWFLQGAASTSLREMETEASLKGILVEDVMERDPLTIGPDVSIQDAVFEFFLGRGRRALPVVEGNRLMGILTLTDVKSVPQQQWSEKKVRDEMTPVPLKSLAPKDELAQALVLLGQDSLNQAPVVDGGQLVGLLSRADIIQYLHSRRELGLLPDGRMAQDSRG